MVRCRCKLEAIMKTSCTNLNPGRRFYCGPNVLFLNPKSRFIRFLGTLLTFGWKLKFQENGCGILDWHDPEMCKRSKKVIPGLLRNINRKQKGIDELEAKLDIEKGQNELLKEEAAELKMKIQSLKCELRNQKVKVRVGGCVLMLVLFLYLLQSISLGDVPQIRHLPLLP